MSICSGGQRRQQERSDGSGLVGSGPSSANRTWARHLSPDQDETAPDDSPRSIPPHPPHGAQPRRGLGHPRAPRSSGARRRRRFGRDHLPDRGSREVLRRLRRSARPGPPRGQRHPHDVALSGRRGRGRHDQVLDDVRARRLHALPLRRERDDLPLHPPQQRPHGEARQPRQVRPGRLVRGRAQERRPRQGRPDDRATTATPAMPRGRITSTSRCTPTTAPMSTRSRT